MTVTCPNGHPVTAGQRFCPECGAAVGESDTAQAATTELPTAPLQVHPGATEPG